MVTRRHFPPIISPIAFPRFNLSQPKIPFSSIQKRKLSCKAQPKPGHQIPKKSFWGAVGLIIGTAVGPGMLGLPAATLKSGPIPSTITIIVSWVYVISSIILVADLSFSAMKEDKVEEVSFTSIAIKAFGPHIGAFVAVVYASLSFSLMVACVSGIGSIVSQCFPHVKPFFSQSVYPVSIAFLMVFFPFSTIDKANRFLCFLMIFSIASLIIVGLPLVRVDVANSWEASSILKAVPVAVLTLGFHVVTPFICKIAGDSLSDAISAILIGGAAPLIMVLSWNAIVLGVSNVRECSINKDAIAVLLGVNRNALWAVKGFAFSALATSLIGYAVSFPKQIVDTMKLIFREEEEEKEEKVKDSHEKLLMMAVMSLAVIIGSFFPSIFSQALDFAGIYANSFLFGILPPAMAYSRNRKKKKKSFVLPGGNFTLFLLFAVAVFLAIRH